MNKLLSIIVPCYNMEQYLSRCLDSLELEKEEHCSLLEVLVINDGSKDKTSAIAHAYAQHFPDSIQVVDKENGHYGSCINAGLSLATGTFVKILEPDDVCDKAGFRGFLNDLNKANQEKKLTEVDLVLTDYAKTNAEGEITYKSDFAYRADSLMEFDEFQKPLKYHILLPAVTYRLSILKNMGYRQTQGCPYTDLEWLTIPMHSVRKIIYWPHTVYMYLIGREGQTVQQENILRNVNIILKLVAGMLRQYQQLLDSERPAVQQYVDKVLLAQLAIIYHAYLLDGRKFYRVEELREFDELLKNSSAELYHAADFTIKSRWFTFHYVENFRNIGVLNRLKRCLFFAYAAMAARPWVK